jgi:hypothetical protein
MAMNDTGKNISGVVMLLLAVGVYFFGQSLLSSNCTGWGWINPLNFCALGVLAKFLAVAFAVWIAMFGATIFALPAEKVPWAILLAIMLPLGIINFFIPDPIPFIDEIIMMLVSGIASVKLLSGSGGSGKQLELF